MMREIWKWFQGSILTRWWPWLRAYVRIKLILSVISLSEFSSILDIPLLQSVFDLLEKWLPALELIDTAEKAFQRADFTMGETAKYIWKIGVTITKCGTPKSIAKFEKYFGKMTTGSKKTNRFT